MTLRLRMPLSVERKSPKTLVVADCFNGELHGYWRSLKCDRKEAEVHLDISRIVLPRLYDRVVEAFLVDDCSKRTEEAYIHWIRRYIEFHQHRHPRQMAEEDANTSLTHLGVREAVAASTQRQALSALLFLYQYVLNQPLDRIEEVIRARRPHRLPVVLKVEEVPGSWGI